jgi:hypothetical protein
MQIDYERQACPGDVAGLSCICRWSQVRLAGSSMLRAAPHLVPLPQLELQGLASSICGVYGEVPGVQLQLLNSILVGCERQLQVGGQAPGAQQSTAALQRDVRSAVSSACWSPTSPGRSPR